MVLKRPFSGEEDDVRSEVPNQEPKRRCTFATIARDVMKGLSALEFFTALEPLLRRVVREEVERAILPFYHSSVRSPRNQSESSQPRAWKLDFVDKLPSTLFTGNRIESEDREPVKIVILDSISGSIVTSGSLSSIKIEILVLDGGFGADDQEDWTENEFNANVVRQRAGKRPLVIGELEIPLKDGVGYVGDVSFTDNSSWIRSRRFRLGARPVSTFAGVRIREARSEAFVVKDHRGESYKKHHPPNLVDEVWRLERISKDGKYHRRLAAEGIATVEDFLKLHNVDPSFLRNVLGDGISNKTWETIIEHANACVLDHKLYMYFGDAEKVGLLVNSILKVVGVTFDGQNYQSLDKLNGFQMGLVESLKRHAYKNPHDLVPFDPPSAIEPSVLSSSLLDDPYSSSSLSNLQNVNFPGLHLDQMEMQLPSSDITMSTSPPYMYNVLDGSQPEVSVAHFCQPMQVFTPALRNSFITRSGCFYGGANDWAPSDSFGPVMKIDHLTATDSSQAGPSTWQGNGLFFAPSNEAIGIGPPHFGIQISKNGKPKARWCMIRAAMKWGISVRRDVAAKRKGKAFIPDFLDWSY